MRCIELPPLGLEHEAEEDRLSSTTARFNRPYASSPCTRPAVDCRARRNASLLHVLDGFAEKRRHLRRGGERLARQRVQFLDDLTGGGHQRLLLLGDLAVPFWVVMRWRLLRDILLTERHVQNWRAAFWSFPPPPSERSSTSAAARP